MRGMVSEPTRLRDRHNQSDLALRIAGQAARDAVETAPLSRAAVARIAAEIDARRGKGRRLRSLSWAMVMGAFLLGIVTAASAARLDLLPRWLTRTVPRAAEHAWYRTAPAAGRRRAPAEKQTPTSPVAPATDEKPAAPPTPGVAPASQEAKAGSNPRGLKPGPQRPQKIAMLADRPAAPSRSATPLLAAPAAEPTDRAAAGERPESLVPSPSPRPTEEQRTAAPSHQPRSDGTPEADFRAEDLSGSPAMAVATPAAAQASLPARPAAASRPSQTASLLKEIVRSLRVEHAPRRALALLDQHGDELAGQAFAEESLLLRVEAMLALGERAAVLRLLDRTALSDLSVSSTLLLTRGELRAAAHRCAEGIGDFDLALAQSRRPPKPALLGRARCKQQVGDLAGARADFDRYRREYPDDPLPGR